MRRAGKIVSLVVLSALLGVPSSALANTATVYVEDTGPEPNGVSIAADFLVARPLGLVATVVGTTIFVLALPFAAMAGDVRTPAELLIVEPARFTFDRPLGAIDL